MFCFVLFGNKEPSFTLKEYKIGVIGEIILWLRFRQSLKRSKMRTPTCGKKARGMAKYLEECASKKTRSHKNNVKVRSVIMAYDSQHRSFTFNLPLFESNL